MGKLTPDSPSGLIGCVMKREWSRWTQTKMLVPIPIPTNPADTKQS